MITVDLGFQHRAQCRNLGLTRGQIFDLYMKYIENMGQFLAVSGSEWQFLSASDFAPVQNWNEEIGNSFLSDGHQTLASSIIKSGTYWPIFYNIQRGAISVVEGGHRIYALQHSQSNQKILSIKHPCIQDPIGVYHQYIICPDADFLQALKNDPYISNIEYIVDHQYHITISDTLTASNLLIIDSMFLSEMIFQALPAVPSSPCINNQNCFIKWYYHQIKRCYYD